MDNIDQMIHTLEFTQIEHEVVKGLKVGNDCLKKLHELMSLDEIEDIMDDTREAIEHQRVISRTCQFPEIYSVVKCFECFMIFKFRNYTV